MFKDAVNRVASKTLKLEIIDVPRLKEAGKDELSLVDCCKETRCWTVALDYP